MTVFENIKKYRKEKRMSQDELARKVGYTDRSTIAKIEAGRMEITQSKIIEIANALGVTPNTLLGYEDSKDIAMLRRLSAYSDLIRKYEQADDKTRKAIDTLLDVDK